MIHGPKHGLPTQPRIDDEMRIDMNCVLYVKSGDGHTCGGLLRKALAEAAHRTGEEIEYGIAGAHSAESKAAVLQIADQNIVLRVDRIEPETDMVRAMDPIDIVGKLICIDIQMSGRASSASNTKTAICHTEAKIVRNQRGDVDTQRLRIKELGVGPT